MTENMRFSRLNPYEEQVEVSADKRRRTYPDGTQLVKPRDGEKPTEGEGEIKITFRLRPEGDRLLCRPDGRKILLTGQWTGWELVHPSAGEKSAGDATEEAVPDQPE
ncbi:hypothetical protein ACQPZP_31010 [Spirillospora sp. CA-142024]|uniref:hypothetical protein n=1 Tax=Spirillospora sp. CA-142024 TaxID=3240036 RepID=UPI003D91E196